MPRRARVGGPRITRAAVTAVEVEAEVPSESAGTGIPIAGTDLAIEVETGIGSIGVDTLRRDTMKAKSSQPEIAGR